MKIIKFDLNQLKKKKDGFSYYILGRSYDLEENDAIQDYDKALEYYKKGNDLRYPLCIYSLGISYELGLGDVLPVDKQKANELIDDNVMQSLQIQIARDAEIIGRPITRTSVAAFITQIILHTESYIGDSVAISEKLTQ